MFYFTSIVIEKVNGNPAGDLFTILYAKNFNPNNIVYRPYARGVRREMIPALLIELSKLYFRQLNSEQEKTEDVVKPPAEVRHDSLRFQCGNCLSIYDPQYGDPQAGIAPGVVFEDLPDSYRCHVCDSPKDDFEILSPKS